MNVYKNIIQSLTEAVDYQKGKTSARKPKLTVKPVTAINIDEIEQIHQKVGLNQVFFAGSPSVFSKTIDVWKNDRNKQEETFYCLLEVLRDDPGSLR
jgi:putative transcriptional regulator